MSQPELDRQIATALGGLAPEPPGTPGLFDTVGARLRRRKVRLRASGAGLLVLAVLVAVPVALREWGPPPTIGTGPTGGASADRTGRPAAVADVAMMLAAVPPPPHASRLPGPSADPVPSLPAGQSSGPVLLDHDPDMESGVQLWTVPSSLDAVHTWLRSHVPPAADLQMDGHGGVGGPISEYDLRYAFPDVTGVLVRRFLEVTATTNGADTAIKFEASSTWLPVRPPAVTIPASVASVTVTLHTKDLHMGDPNVPARTFGPTTITDPARVRSVVALVNGLPLQEPIYGPHSCLPAFGGSMDVTFSDSAGLVLERLSIAMSACASNVITAPDGTTASIANPRTGSYVLGTEIRKLLGLNWAWTT